MSLWLCCCCSSCHVTCQQLKMLSQETVHRNRINFAASEKVMNSIIMILYFIFLFIYLFYFFIYSKSLIPVRRLRRVNVKCICLRHETVLLFSMSCDWETVYNYFIPFCATVKTITHEVLWMTRCTVARGRILCNSQNYHPRGAFGLGQQCIGSSTAPRG